MSPERTAEIRRFAVAVGCVLIGFTLVASLWHSFGAGWVWSGFVLRRAWVGGLGFVLLVLGYVAPGLLDGPEKLWMKFAHVLTPLGFMARLVGWDKLRLKKPPGEGSLYEAPAEHLADPKHFEHPF